MRQPTKAVPMGTWLALVRSLRLLSHLLRGMWTMHRHFSRFTADERQRRVQQWSRQTLAILGVELLVQGEPPAQGPVLVVANHISWLDIVVMNAARPCRFVAKADIRAWPLLGGLVAGAGTLFIEREKRSDAVRVTHHLAERLQAGDVLAVFPEGTTGDGRTLLPFHANLLQAAVVTNAPALPVGLAYRDAASGQRHEAPIYTGDTTLVASVWCTLRARGLQAVVHYGLPDQAMGRDRRSWSTALRGEIAQILDVPIAD